MNVGMNIGYGSGTGELGWEIGSGIGDSDVMTYLIYLRVEINNRFAEFIIRF